jgi:N-acetylglucosaminyldiphosphoundecaprenol N-acetyl-beta-D-mannosaminyltransferase
VTTAATGRYTDAAYGANAWPRSRVAGLEFDMLTEAQVVEHVIARAAAGRGGWVATPNIDFCRSAKAEPGSRELIEAASLVVPDGKPLLWAARLRGTPLPERVTGASLIFSLSEAAARAGCPVYFLGGAPGIPERAGEELRRRYPGLTVAGADSPPPGFDATPGGLDLVRDGHHGADPVPGLVFAGLGFPRQERVITSLAPQFPGTWFIGCGAAIPFAAGALPRAPQWMQRCGLEWLFRLICEPRRLFRRYVVHDLPFALALLAASAAARIAR